MTQENSPTLIGKLTSDPALISLYLSAQGTQIMGISHDGVITWAEDAYDKIESGDFGQSQALRHLLRIVWKATHENRGLPTITENQIEIILDAALEWSEYVVEDTAPISNYSQIKHAISKAFPMAFQEEE